MWNLKCVGKQHRDPLVLDILKNLIRNGHNCYFLVIDLYFLPLRSIHNIPANLIDLIIIDIPGDNLPTLCIEENIIFFLLETAFDNHIVMIIGHWKFDIESGIIADILVDDRHATTSEKLRYID